jgi:hypothetical protein
MASKCMKKCLTSMDKIDMWIKTTLRFHLTPVRMAIFKSKIATNAGNEAMQQEPLYTVGGNAN